MNYTSLSAIADLLLPRSCLVCGTSLIPAEQHLCLPCLARMPLTHFEKSSHNPMADRLNASIQRRLEEDGFPETLEKYAYAAALFFYDGTSGYEKIPQSLKYHRNLSAGEYFGNMLANRLKSSELYRDLDLIIPVPLHWTRKWKRGYNQAEVIAASISRKLDVPMNTDLILRKRNTKTQTKVSVEVKGTNIKGAFEINPRSHFQADMEPSHILLIDDTFTTGATLSECLLALRRHFGESIRISSATLAYVGH